MHLFYAKIAILCVNRKDEGEFSFRAIAFIVAAEGSQERTPDSTKKGAHRVVRPFHLWSIVN
jgi:hypothetical protein